jgi:serine/threonine protein kinase
VADVPQSKPSSAVDDLSDSTIAPTDRTPAPSGGESAHLILAPGSRPIADFELMERLGRGGFGEVWKARGPGGFCVALKFVRLGERPGTIELRSLELIKNLRHTHLIGIFGAWQREDTLILAMELGDRTLLDRLREAEKEGQPGIPAPELLECMREAAKGIDHLNGKGIQHRDIKPHNLLLVGGGVKVADFGLAKLLENSRASNSGTMTPAYAAPEFLKKDTSSRSDQYSLAVSYCQLRGGRLPFTGDPAQIMVGHLMHEPDLTMLPEEERPVLARALSKEPEQRWRTCLEFVEALYAARNADVRSKSAPALSIAPLAATTAREANTLAEAPRPASARTRRDPLPSSATESRRHWFLWVGVLLLAAGIGVFVRQNWNDTNPKPVRENETAVARNDRIEPKPAEAPTSLPPPSMPVPNPAPAPKLPLPEPVTQQVVPKAKKMPAPTESLLPQGAKELVRSKDGRLVYFVDVFGQLISRSTANNGLIAKTSPGGPPLGAVVSADSDRLYLLTTGKLICFDANTLAMIWSANLSGDARQIALSADERQVRVFAGLEVRNYDARIGKRLDSPKSK